MASFNSCTFIGNLGQDPQLRYTPNGKAVANFSIAVNDGAGQNQKTLWMPVVCWDKTAENAAKYLAKGRPVLVSGRMQENVWTDKNGEEQKRMEVVAFSVVFLGDGQNKDAHAGPEGQWNREGGPRNDEPRGGNRAGNAPASNRAPHRQQGPAQIEDPDIPF